MKATFAKLLTGEVAVTVNNETVVVDPDGPIVEIIDTLLYDLDLSEEQADKLAFRVDRFAAKN